MGTKHCIKCSVTFPGCQSCYYTSNIYGYIIDVISQGNQANTLRCYTCIKPDDYVNALYNGCKSCSDVPNGGILKCD